MRAAWATALAFALMACAEGPDIVIEGELELPSCGNPLPWEPSFATYTASPDGSALIRFQGEPGPLDAQDHFVATFPDISAVQASVGETLVIDHDDPDAVQASLNFYTTCSASVTTATVASGWMRFDAFSGDYGTEAEGTFELDVFDARTGDLLGEGVVGTFRFDIERYRPYQSFN